MIRSLYQTSATLAAPFLTALLARRARRGKEDPARLSERRGIASYDRPPGPLVWVHAASNGESISALPLVEQLIATHPTRSVLVTTGTLTSAGLMADRLPERAFHQFVPLDCPPWVRAFLSHWQPNLGIWIESEFWPSLIWEMRRAGKPIALVNGRMSQRSVARWRRYPQLAKDLLSGFAPCLTQTEQDAENLALLGAVSPECVGNLKLSGAPLPVQATALTRFRQAAGQRPIWLAASTHPGEEEIIAEAHQALQNKFPSILTVLVPRHPHRGAEIARMLQDRGIIVTRRSEGNEPSQTTQIYVADTLGELGLFYRTAPIALIGGSLAGDHGGHNPLEAAHLDCRVLHGPDMKNFSTVAKALADRDGAATIRNAKELADAVASALSVSLKRDPGGEDPGRKNAEKEADQRNSISENLEKEGQKTLEAVMHRLSPVLHSSGAS